MAAEPCLIDSNAFSELRIIWEKVKVHPFDVVGSEDLAISSVIYDELVRKLPPDDHKVRKIESLIAEMGDRVIRTTDADATAADDMLERYREHLPPWPDPSDALIAATAMRVGRIVVTRNWKHFHFVLDLRTLILRPWPTGRPWLEHRPVALGDHEGQCCERLASRR
jgi:predicted nucleic acid-binding protein